MGSSERTVYLRAGDRVIGPFSERWAALIFGAFCEVERPSPLADLVRQWHRIGMTACGLA